ncbi:hypothetical protein [Micromonospora sp. NBC_00617]|uniref:hypothetical protein n=1 Tax=Micromonospora sp. NBC_00617 TaxID=2903587 RepID=UPI0030E4D7F1
MPESYSWNFFGDPSETEPSDRLPSDVKIERFALSFILVPFNNFPAPSITAVNIHPDTWNTLMFPYGGLRLDDAEVASDASTFHDLSAVLRRLIGANLDDYLSGARTELAEYYSQVPDLKDLAPVYRNFSLKFSKSAEKWTAYIFTYHPCPLSQLAVPDVARREIPLTKDRIGEALKTNQVEGVSLEENVAALLRTRIVDFWSQD